MLSTYKNCGCCKKEMTKVKVLLNNIFPAGIYDEICNYNLHCSKCKELNDKKCKYNSGPAVRIWENQTSVFNASPGYICFHMLLSCVNSHIEFKK